ncbi:MAG: hypothetical protein N2316_11315 [Spirochaetes bacterium]|nr:hypothetical protein [Spirochaetota bacterium]
MKKMTSTSQLQENQILRVYLKGYGYATLSILDVNMEFFSARGEKQFISRLQKGDRLEAYVWSEKFSAYEFDVEVLGTLDDELCIVFFKHSHDMRFSPQRKCLTANVELPFEFFIFEVANKQKFISLSQVEKLHGMIVKLSDREAWLSCQNELPLGKYVMGHLNLPNANIELIAKVERSSERDYYLKFIGLREREREKLLEFVFRAYRE